MRLVCKKCGFMFETLIIDQKIAFNDLGIKSSNHIKFKHPEIFEALAVAIQKCSMALAQLLHFDECIVVPEEEVWILSQLEEAQKVVMMALGFDPEEDDDDEDEDDDEGDDGVGEPAEVVEIDKTKEAS